MSTTNGDHSRFYHRQPLGYGPATGPRQDLFTEKPYPTWHEAGMHLARIVYSTERSAIEGILPPGFSVEEDAEPTIMFEVMNLSNLPWLAGRGYNTTGVYLNNIIHEETSTRGSLLSVLFESFTDPIVTGREELGFPKVFATTTDPIIAKDGTREYGVSWLGHEFMRLRFPKLKETDPPTSRTFQHSSPAVDGLLAYRYMPAIGRPGEADAEYAVYLPPPTKPDDIKTFYVPGEGSTANVKITKSTFEQLPTLHYIVNRLASIPLKGVKEQCVIDQRGASDVSRVVRL